MSRRAVAVPSRHKDVLRTLYLEERSFEQNVVTLTVTDVAGSELAIAVDKYLLLDAIEPLW